MSLKPVYGQDKTRLPDQGGTDLVISVVDQIRQSGIFSDDFNLLERIAFVASMDGRNLDTYRPGFDGGIWQVCLLHISSRYLDACQPTSPTLCNE